MGVLGPAVSAWAYGARGRPLAEPARVLDVFPLEPLEKRRGIFGGFVPSRRTQTRASSEASTRQWRAVRKRRHEPQGGEMREGVEVAPVVFRPGRRAPKDAEGATDPPRHLKLPAIFETDPEAA